MLEFEWDEQKRQSNLNKHDIDFVRACQIFQGYTVEFEDTRYNYGEDRFIAIGQTGNQTLTVVYTLRDEIIRLISARKATKNERKIYDENKATNLRRDKNRKKMPERRLRFSN